MIEMRTKWCEFWDILHHFGGWMCWFWTCQPRHLQSACHGLLGQKFWCGWIRDIGIGKEPQWQGTLGKSSLHRRNALGTPRHKLWPGSLPQAQEDKSGFRTCTSHRFIMVYLYSSLSFWFENLQSNFAQFNGVASFSSCFLRRYWCSSRKTCLMASWANVSMAINWVDQVHSLLNVYFCV